MGILPVASIVIELFAGIGSDLLFLVGKWFVFWASGVRLFIAGLSQIFRPDFTAKSIMGVSDPAAGKLVSELGFANLAIGFLGMATLYQTAWLVPAAIVSGLFYVFAGGKHVLNRDRNRKEDIAMISDLVLFVVLAVFVIGTLLSIGE
jgi:hypothetical protein